MDRNTEILEHDLCLLSGKEICLVRKGFGTQSDSWYGELKIVGDKYPIQFQFKSPSQCILFYVEDVICIDYAKTTSGCQTTIVRLKGPSDYDKKETCKEVH